VHVFSGCIKPTAPGNFEFTYRVGLKESSLSKNEWQWAGSYQQNGRLQVFTPNLSLKWTHGPNFVQLVSSLYVGNFAAAAHAQELGFDSVLNMASELTVSFDDTLRRVEYKKISLPDGAHNPIPLHDLKEAVEWIHEQLSNNKKVLVHCRAGIGRSGSTAIAYCYFLNSGWTYQKTLDYVWSKKPDIYPHTKLQESLEILFPRNTSK